MRVLSLFSGGGLGDYGLELAGMEIVGQVEIDDYCQKILKLRWPEIPKYRDICEVKGKEVIERIGQPDLISGGFPCQPFSTAGNRAGAKDERNLWPEMHRLICEIKPRWVLAENVPGLLSIDAGRVFGGILRDLAKSGYCVEWDCIPASAVGAPHRRDRVWIVAHSDSSRCGQPHIFSKQPWRTETISPGKNMANTKSQRQPRRNLQSDTRNESEDQQNWNNGRGKVIKYFRQWESESSIRRVVDGSPNRLERLKLLGNGQVVQVVQWIGEKIMEFECQNTL